MPPEVDPNSIPVALIALSGTVATIFFTWFKFRRSQTSADRNLGYDQVQEDLTNERAARVANEAILRADIASLKRELADVRLEMRIKDDYIGTLRSHIDQRKDPPPPAWPVALTRADDQHP